MTTRRQKRFNELLFEELSLLVPEPLAGDGVASLFVTRVEAAQDLSTAKVYVASDDPSEPSAAIDAALDALDEAEGSLRGELAILGLRRLPKLIFAHDTAYEHGERVLGLLRSLSRDAPTASTAPDA